MSNNPFQEEARLAIAKRDRWELLTQAREWTEDHYVPANLTISVRHKGASAVDGHEQAMTLLAEHFSKLAPYRFDLLEMIRTEMVSMAPFTVAPAPEQTEVIEDWRIQSTKEKQMNDEFIFSWNAYFMGFATHAAKKSKDETKVGAVLVGPDGEVRLTGYNGPPRGVHDLPERRVRPAKYTFVSHAEANIIAFAAREGIRTSGCTVYVTHACCCDCMKALIQAGVSRVVYGPGVTSMPAEMFESAKIMAAEAGLVYRAYQE